MSICVILTVFALGMLLYILLSSRQLIASKEGFVEYIVYGPGPYWGFGPRRPWWRRHMRFREYMPRRAMWFY